MGVFLQVYNLKVDDKTHKADATVEYRVTMDKANDPVLKFDLGGDKLPVHGEEMTLENIITLGSLKPGKYKLEVAVTDNLAKKTITPATEFTRPANRFASATGEVSFMNFRMIRAMGLGMILCLSWCVIAAPATAAPSFRKDYGSGGGRSGTPQMGATVMITSDQLLNSMVFQLLTNDRGRFSSATLPAGIYSVKVTLAGFLRRWSRTYRCATSTLRCWKSFSVPSSVHWKNCAASPISKSPPTIGAGCCEHPLRRAPFCAGKMAT